MLILKPCLETTLLKICVILVYLYPFLFPTFSARLTLSLENAQHTRIYKFLDDTDITLMLYLLCANIFSAKINIYDFET